MSGRFRKRVGDSRPTGFRHPSAVARISGIASGTKSRDPGRATVVVALCAAVLVPQAATQAVQDATASAALAAAQRRADCPGCEFVVESKRPAISAARGLLSVGVLDSSGGGYVTIMGYTGSRWAPLWEGNGGTRNVDSLPGRIAICMDEGGWTNVRTGPGLGYRRVGKVRRPTVKKALELRLTSRLGKREGVAWYRIRLNGRPAWVQNLRTLAAPRGSATRNCRTWREFWSRRQ